MPVINGRHVGGRTRPPGGHTFRLERFNVNLAKLAPAPSETNYRGKSASVLGTCWANGPSNASPPADVVLGDCTTEASFHGIAFRQGRAGSAPFMPSVAQVIANYSLTSGYNGNPDTDNGADEVAVLSAGVLTGYPNGDKLKAYLMVDASNVPLRRAMNATFGGGFACIETPDDFMGLVPQDAVANGTFVSPVCTWGKGASNPQNGHCVFSSDLAPKGEIVDSWGLPVLFTDDGLAELAVESAGGSYYVVLDADMLPAAVISQPDALDWRALVTAWDAEGGAVPIPGAAAPATGLVAWLEGVLAQVGRAL